MLAMSFILQSPEPPRCRDLTYVDYTNFSISLQVPSLEELPKHQTDHFTGSFSLGFCCRTCRNTSVSSPAVPPLASRLILFCWEPRRQRLRLPISSLSRPVERRSAAVASLMGLPALQVCSVLHRLPHNGCASLSCAWTFFSCSVHVTLLFFLRGGSVVFKR